MFSPYLAPRGQLDDHLPMHPYLRVKRQPRPPHGAAPVWGWFTRRHHSVSVTFHNAHFMIDARHRYGNLRVAVFGGRLLDFHPCVPTRGNSDHGSRLPSRRNLPPAITRGHSDLFEYLISESVASEARARRPSQTAPTRLASGLQVLDAEILTKALNVPVRPTGSLERCPSGRYMYLSRH